MKQGRTLEELGAELQRQRAARKDFITDTRYLEFNTNEEGRATLSLDIKGELQTFGVDELAHKQIAQRLMIPYRYYQKMQVEQPELLDTNVNTWLKFAPERRMIRTLDGSVRAFLSDRYRRLDNLELCEAVLPIIKDMPGAEITSCDVTPDHMYLKVINKKLKEEVSTGDVVQAGFVISNSEVGLGSVKVEPLIYRLVCKNGLILKDYTQKKYHVGKQVDGDSAYELYSDQGYVIHYRRRGRPHTGVVRKVFGVLSANVLDSGEAFQGLPSGVAGYSGYKNSQDTAGRGSESLLCSSWDRLC